MSSAVRRSSWNGGASRLDGTIAAYAAHAGGVCPLPQQCAMTQQRRVARRDTRTAAPLSPTLVVHAWNKSARSLPAQLLPPTSLQQPSQSTARSPLHPRATPNPTQSPTPSPPKAQTHYQPPWHRPPKSRRKTRTPASRSSSASAPSGECAAASVLSQLTAPAPTCCSPARTGTTTSCSLPAEPARSLKRRPRPASCATRSLPPSATQPV